MNDWHHTNDKIIINNPMPLNFRIFSHSSKTEWWQLFLFPNQENFQIHIAFDRKYGLSQFIEIKSRDISVTKMYIRISTVHENESISLNSVCCGFYVPYQILQLNAQGLFLNGSKNVHSKHPYNVKSRKKWHEQRIIKFDWIS